MLYILIVLVITLYGLIKSRKENEEMLENISIVLKDNFNYEEKHNELIKSNGSLKGWISKYKNTIKIQSDNIKKLNCVIDESYIAMNAIGNESKKTKRLELLDKFMNKGNE